MKLPRNLYGTQLVKALRVLDYDIVRQRGSHIRVMTKLNGVHKEVIPNHKPIKPGTLSSILKSIAAHHKLSLQELIEKLDF